jgi:hypothetical protein
MQNKTPIIIIAVLSALALGLGYWVGLPKEGSGNGGGKKEPEFLKQGLVAYYPFNGNAKDESGNGYHGTTMGSPVFITDRHGAESRACRMNGGNDYILVEKEMSLTNANFCTASIWIKSSLESKGTALQVLGKSPGGNFVSGHLGITKGEGPFVGWFSRKDGDSMVRKIEDKQFLNWIHLCGVWKQISDNAITVTLYVNGDKSEARQTPNIMFPDHQFIIIGRQSHGGSQYNGTLDDIRIYNRALSEAEVKELYEFEKVK